MTITLPVQDRILTADQYAALGDDDDLPDLELLDGSLVLSPSASFRHMRAVSRLLRALADAGIPHYRIVELEPTVWLIACRLVDGRYVDDGPVTGRFHTDTPFPLTIDLDLLA